MILKGDLSITSDKQICVDMVAMGYVAIAISEDYKMDEQFVMATNIKDASILLPPYEVMMYDNQGNSNLAIEMYHGYLSTKDPNVFIAIILRALFNGMNIVLFLTKSEAKLNYMSYFINYLLRFGIVPSIPESNIVGIFDKKYSYFVAGCIYSAELMTAQELVMSLTLEELNNLIMIDSIAMSINRELNLYSDSIKSIIDIKSRIMDFKKQIDSSGKLLIPAIGRSDASCLL